MADDRASSWQTLGGDRLLVRDDRLLVVSTADMADWKVREFRRAAISFRGDRYLVESREFRDSKHHYVLRRWPEESGEMPGLLIDYDETYVAERDAYLAAEARANQAEPLLVALYPLIGLLPSGLQRSLSDRFGLRVKMAIVSSLFLELAVAIVCVALLGIEFGAGGVGAGLGVPGGSIGAIGFENKGLILLLVIPDLAFRYTRLLAEQIEPCGFWEWLWNRKASS